MHIKTDSNLSHAYKRECSLLSVTLHLEAIVQMCSIGFILNFPKISGKQLCQSFFEKVTGLKYLNLLKKSPP